MTRETAGADVLAIADGTVVFAGSDYPGRVVIVQHEAELFSMYGHLDYALEVTEGDTVTIGQRLGTVLLRTDGRAPSHLHFEVRTFLITPEVNGDQPRYGFACDRIARPDPATGQSKRRTTRPISAGETRRMSSPAACSMGIRSHPESRRSFRAGSTRQPRSGHYLQIAGRLIKLGTNTSLPESATRCFRSRPDRKQRTVGAPNATGSGIELGCVIRRPAGFKLRSHPISKPAAMADHRLSDSC